MTKEQERLDRKRIYKLWRRIKDRCYNENYVSYSYCGARGIRMCASWYFYSSVFIKWALENGWQRGLYIDRIDNEKHYYPENCRFVDKGLNARNKRLIRETNTCGYCGAHWHKTQKKWFSQIRINSKTKYLGSFDSPRLAALRYDAEAYLLNDGRPRNFF